MLRNIEAPSDLGAWDRAPEMSREEKLKTIRRTPVTLFRSMYGTYSVQLPLVGGASFELRGQGRPKAPDTIHMKSLNVGDGSLYKEGIGSRLLKASIAYAVAAEPDVRTLTAEKVYLGSIRTAARVLGAENLRIDHAGQGYGLDAEKLLDEVTEDYPHVPGQVYIVNSLTARIDHSKIVGWEVPVLMGANQPADQC